MGGGCAEMVLPVGRRAAVDSSRVARQEMGSGDGALGGGQRRRRWEVGSGGGGRC
jgi:hypothetical protein